MKIVIAPDKFKGCLSAQDVARAIAAGIKQVDPSITIDECPMADGGEGTVAALVAATNGKIITRKVTGPLPRMKVDAPIGLLGGGETAVIEMSAASGLFLLKDDQRDPSRTTTYGTGELLKEAAALGVDRIILGIGGSATVDGGIGAAQAWGARIKLISGQSYGPDDRRITGGDLTRLLSIEGNVRTTALATRSAKAAAQSARPLIMDGHLLDTEGIEFIVACDVGSPLLGPDGASVIFGPQKGASPEQVMMLEAGLRKLAEKTGLRHLAELPGAGAAGGLGFGMMAFFGATLKPGIDIVINATKLRERLKGADLCITGEGKLDAQSLAGKTAIGVARLCKEMKIPCIALAGSIGVGAEKSLNEGISAYTSICDRPMPLEEAIARAPSLLEQAAASLIRVKRCSRYG